jgi:archaeal flagellar protein FlaH
LIEGGANVVYKIGLERDELEGRFGGGFPEGALVIVEGEYGCGKSVLAERLVYGFLQNHVKVSFVSTELTTLHFIDQMHSLDYPIEEFTLDKRLLFLPVYPILGHRGKKADLLERLVNAKRMYEQDVIVIDAYSTLLKQWMKSVEDDPTVEPMDGMEETLYLFKLLAARGKTIILTMDPGDVHDELSSVLRAAADVYLNVRLSTAGGAVERSVMVRRFERAEAAVSDIVPFRVEPKAGFIVEIKSVS